MAPLGTLLWEIMFIALVTAAVAVFIPAAVLFIEIAASLFPSRKKPVALPGRSARPRIAVLVPAHDESRGLLPTLEDVRGQLQPGDRVLVVADNCTDDTAAVAAAAGAEVIERRDETRRGKGFALAFGISHLRADPPDVVVVMDADCRIAAGSLDALAVVCVVACRPAQALYLMSAPAQSRLNQQVAEFAWVLKNHMRSRGLGNLGLPCQLMGTGMAFPWLPIATADLAHAHLAEDLLLGLDLAARGNAPVFCPEAVVTSTFPTTAAGAETQRARWESGHLSLLRSTAVPLAARAIGRGDLRLLAMALDACVPPLSLLALVTTGMLTVTAIAAYFGAPLTAFAIAATAAFLLFVSVLTAWLGGGHRVLPAASLGRLPLYVLGKLGFYARLTRGNRVSHWIRTDRT